MLVLAKSVLHICDREADFYEFFDRLIANDIKFLIRNYHNRKLWQSSVKLKDWINTKKAKGLMSIKLNRDSKRWRKNKQIELSIKYEAVNLKATPQSDAQGDFIPLYIIEAKQVNNAPNQPPVHWYLLTNQTVDSLEKAKYYINCYSIRWQVEEWFAVTKQKGFNFEKSQLCTQSGLLKLLVIVLFASMRHLILTKKRENQTELAEEYFTEPEIEVLKKLEQKLQGNTSKQQNPYHKMTIAWAAWIVARLGGWMGYQSQAPPGIKIMKYGLERLSHIMILYEP